MTPEQIIHSPFNINHKVKNKTFKDCFLCSFCIWAPDHYFEEPVTQKLTWTVFIQPRLAISETILSNNDKATQQFLVFTLPCFEYLKPCLIFFQLGDTHEVTPLLLGQRTGNTTQLKAGSEDYRRHFTAEHIKTWESCNFVTGQVIAQTQCILKTWTTLPKRRKMLKIRKTKLKTSLLIIYGFFSDHCWAALNLQHVTEDHGSVCDIFPAGMFPLTVYLSCYI